MADAESVVQCLQRYIGLFTSQLNGELSQEEMKGFNDQIAEVTNQLVSFQQAPGYAEILIQIFLNNPLEQTLGNIIMTQLKNTIKNYWQNDQLFSNKDEIHHALLNLILQNYVNQSEATNNLLITTIGIISQNDFPHKWADFNDQFQELCMHITAESVPLELIPTINAMLLVVYEVFHNFEDSDRNDDKIQRYADTWIEIVINLMLFIANDIFTTENVNPIFVELICTTFKLYSCLMKPELPTQFLDNLQATFQLLGVLVEADIDSPKNNDLKMQICEITKNFTLRYPDKIARYAENRRSQNMEFTEENEAEFKQTWYNLLYQIIQMLFKQGQLLNTDEETDIEPLSNQTIVAGFKVVTDIVKQQTIRTEFMELYEFRSIFDIVAQFLGVTQEMVETIQTEPLKYFNDDITGMDMQIETPRKAAYNLMKVLNKFYGEQLQEIYVSEIYNPSNLPSFEEWDRVDQIIFFTGILIPTKTNFREGVVDYNEEFPLSEFVEQFIIPCLAPNFPYPILQADAIKFYVEFRSVIDAANITAKHFPTFFALLGSQSPTAILYGAYLIERLCASKTLQIDSEFLVSQNVVSIIDPLMRVLKMDNQPCPYIGRVLVRITTVAASALTPKSADMIQRIIRILREELKNPSDPEFVHNMWDIIAALLIYSGAPLAQVEKPVMDLLIEIIDQEFYDFIPYAIQMLAALINAHTEGQELNPYYVEMFNNFMAENMWLPAGNIPALQIAIAAYSRAYPQMVLEAAGVIMERCSFLLTKYVTMAPSFNILSTLISIFDRPPAMVTEILNIIIGNFSESMPKYRRTFAIFMCYCVTLMGADAFVQCIPADKIDLTYKEWGNDIQYVGSNKKDMDRVTAGAINFLRNCTVATIEQWSMILCGLIRMIERPVDTIKEEIMATKEDEESAKQFDTTFSRLTSVEKPVIIEGEIPENTNLSLFIAVSLTEIGQLRPQWIPRAIEPLENIIKESFLKMQERYAEHGVVFQ